MTAAAPPDEVEAWAAYHVSRSTEDRNALVEMYLCLVDGVLASRSWVRRGGVIERADLHQYGVLGLVDAVERFEVDRGLRFASFARWRIAGAIRDGLRQEDWLPRSVRHRLEPDEAARTRPLSMDETVLSHGKGAAPSEKRTRGDLVADPSVDVEADGTAAVSADELGRAIAGLPERQALVVRRYFADGMRLAAIGAELGVTESRACQILAKALRNLRQHGHLLVAS